MLGSAPARLLGLPFRIPPGAWISVYCQVEISANGRTLVHRGPTESGVSECDLDTSKMRRPRAIRAVEP